MTDLQVEKLSLSEVLASKSSVGRPPNPRDAALDDLVRQAGDMKNADSAFAWKYEDKKPTAVQAARKAIERNGLVGSVFASTKGDTIIFSQIPLRKSRTK